MCRWIKRSRDDQAIEGRVNTDASRISDSYPDAMRLGWAFIVVDNEGHVTNIASGVPPCYIEDIPVAETWALVQATTFASMGTTFTSDCLPCVEDINKGRGATCTAKSPLARPLMALFDNMGALLQDAFVWMPSHTNAAAVGCKLRSDGNPTTADDRKFNAVVDLEAKRAAAHYAVPSRVVKQFATYYEEVTSSLRWLGMASHMATHYRQPPERDAESIAFT